MRGNGSRNGRSNLGLTSDSFAFDDDEDTRKRVIAIVEGNWKEGKTHFCLTAPDPIVLFNFDAGTEGLVQQARRRGKKVGVAGVPGMGAVHPIYSFEMPVPRKGQSRKDKDFLEAVKLKALPVAERFISDLDEFYHSDARTGIIDTGTSAYELFRLAEFGLAKGKPDDPYGARGGPMKALFRSFIIDGYKYDKNVLWVHRLKDEWVGKEQTGRRVLEGYAPMAYEAQMTLRVAKAARRGQNEFSVTVTNCRLDQGMENEVFEGKECNFPFVAASIFGTDEDEWR